MEDAAGVRLEAVEQRMEVWEARFDAAVTSLEEQISLSGDEIRMELSAIREAIESGDARVRTELTGEIGESEEWLRAEIGASAEQLQTEIRAGDEETRRFMRVLHEDLVDRIARLGDAR